MTVYSSLDDLKLPFSKIGILQTSDEGIETQCLICEKPLRIIKDKLYAIIDVFCGEKCLSQGYESIEVSSSDVVATKSQRGVCESCGGLPRGRGWCHKEGCPELVEVKPKRKCEKCGGIARGRGFRHLGTCSKKISQPQKSIRLCSICQGPARGRGFIHSKTCKGETNDYCNVDN